MWAPKVGKSFWGLICPWMGLGCAVDVCQAAILRFLIKNVFSLVALGIMMYLCTRINVLRFPAPFPFGVTGMKRESGESPGQYPLL